MIYRSMLTADNIEACVRRLRKEEDGADYCENLVSRFRKLMIKLEIKISDIKVVDNTGSSNTSYRHNILICRKDKKIQVSFPISYPQPDLSDILLAIRSILLKSRMNFEEYCEYRHINTNDHSSKIEYKDHFKAARRLSRMFNDKELSCLPTTSSVNDDLVLLESISERDKLDDLLDNVRYYDKLLGQYGYDAKKGEWNVREFPITQNDKQMDGIKSDIQKADKAIDEYNEYLEYLTVKYSGDVDKIGKYVFIPPPRIKPEASEWETRSGK